MKTYEDYHLKLVGYRSGNYFNYMLVSNAEKDTVNILDIINQPISPGGCSTYNIYYKHNELLLSLKMTYAKSKYVRLAYHKDIVNQDKYKIIYDFKDFLDEVPCLFKRITLMAFE